MITNIKRELSADDSRSKDTKRNFLLNLIVCVHISLCVSKLEDFLIVYGSQRLNLGCQAWGQARFRPETSGCIILLLLILIWYPGLMDH